MGEGGKGKDLLGLIREPRVMYINFFRNPCLYPFSAFFSFKKKGFQIPAGRAVRTLFKQDKRYVTQISVPLKTLKIEPGWVRSMYLHLHLSRQTSV